MFDKKNNKTKFGDKGNSASGSGNRSVHSYGSKSSYFIDGSRKKSNSSGFGSRSGNARNDNSSSYGSKFSGPRDNSSKLNSSRDGSRFGGARSGAGSRFSSSRSGGSGSRFGGSRSGGGRGNRRNFREGIDISCFVNKATINTKEEVKPIIENAFADFDLCPEIQKNLQKKGYVTPTPIQDQTIKHVLEGCDIMGLAQTGTGKTAAFLLPMINKVFKDKGQKVLIIAPTRELAQQIEQEFREFSWAMQIFSAVCVGGMPIYKQIGNLRRNPNFVIGTPGRLKDLCERKVIKFEQFQNIILDEVDRMLDMGFVDEIKLILNQLPEKRQSLFFSATMPEKTKDLVNKFLNNPVNIEIPHSRTTENIEQDIIHVRNKSMKMTQLKDLLNRPELKKTLIFSETKRDVEKLADELSNGGFKVDSIHGDKKQHQRQRALKSFRDDAVNILVATDVAARGLDIPDVTHVINYTVPQTLDDYTHRIGRTGRANKKGVAFTFVDAK